MPQTKILKANGSDGGTVELVESLFAARISESLIHQAVIRQLAGRRVGTADTQTRGEVTGGGKKPWRQKGTGRARQGTKTAPHWTGGGVVFGPHPRKYTQAMPKKMRRLAIRSALSAKQADGQIRFVDALAMATPRTKAVIELLQNLQASDIKTLIVLSEKNENISRSANNLPHVKTLLASYLNVIDLLKYDLIVLPQSALAIIDNWLGTTRIAAEEESEA